jgi:hypothetical protein
MASGTCTTVAQGFLNTWFNGATMSPAFPSAWSIALDTGVPTAAGLQFEVSSGNGYAELSITRNTTNFPTISSGNTMNNGVTFAFATSTGAWTGNSGANTTIQGAVIKDSTTIGSGNPWWYGLLTSAQTIVNNNVLQFLANNFSVQLS